MKDKFINAGFTVVGSEKDENRLVSFLKANYPSVIKDGELDLYELKAVLGLPINEKVNGYGLNFVGRNFARAKYAKEADRELRLNTNLSKNIDTTQNLVLKGDNIDSLKILKSYYTSKIKCIYIDPPYNTANDEFVYPDRFDKQEAEVLGLTDLSDDDFARLEFSFRTKRSHNGWLSFMYPRLLLARDLLSDDGVIFISIDDNEQANLKLLCDDVFGEENFVLQITWRRTDNQPNIGNVARVKEYVLVYCKNSAILKLGRLPLSESALKEYRYEDAYALKFRRGILLDKTRGHEYYPVTTKSGKILNGPWMVTEEKFRQLEKEDKIYWTSGGEEQPYTKIYLKDNKGVIPNDFWGIEAGTNQRGSSEVEELFNRRIFDFPKPISLIKKFIQISTKNNDIILDFFAGSGTTGHAVMQLNAEDGSNRKFILCQLDEPIKKEKLAYQFCIENGLPPFISSITIERLKRAGEKITKEFEIQNAKNSLFEKSLIPTLPITHIDIGFKVFDSMPKPRLKVDDEGQISMPFNDIDTLSRIYNIIFTIGLDEPTQVPNEVLKDCIYKVGNNYYITNSGKISANDYANVIKKAYMESGRVFVDGWTANLNATLQNYKEHAMIVF